MNPIDNLYKALVSQKSDINEHLPTLKKYAEECEHITEMGVRYIVSTIALLVAKPKTLICIDLFSPSHYGDQSRFYLAQQYANENNVKFNFLLGNTLEIDIEETDMLFIDTLHRYGQLKAELERHSSKVKKYIIFHDTTTFENVDEGCYYPLPTLDTSKTGLWPAIQEFMATNPQWSVLERFTNNNGLTVLCKKQ